MLTLGDSELIEKIKSYFYLKIIKESTRRNEKKPLFGHGFLKANQTKKYQSKKLKLFRLNLKMNAVNFKNRRMMRHFE